MELSTGDILIKIVYSICQTVFLGFSLFTILYVSVSIRNEAKNTFDDIHDSATLLIRFIGIAFFILIITTNIFNYIEFNDKFEKYGTITRLIRPFGFLFWIQIFTFAFLNNLYWVEKIKKNNFYKVLHSVIILFVLFIMNFELYVIIITSFNRDYVPSEWGEIISYPELLISINLKIGIFLFLLGLTHFIKIKFKPYD